MSFWDELLPPDSQASLFVGILNLTPDSFSDGGRFQSLDAALRQARKLVQSGAGMLDLGAESTRPGAAGVSPDEEWRRLEPVVHNLRLEFPKVPLSLDTRHGEVAKKGLEAGIAVLNDVTGFSTPAMLAAAQTSTCGLIAMRSRRHADRLWMPPYDGPAQGNPIAELSNIRDRLLIEACIEPGRVLLDPGFGFGTTFEGDRSLWSHLRTLPDQLSWPVARFCLGISRKRFLAWRAATPDLPPQDRDALTKKAHQEALALGYRVFRTHAV